MPHRYEITVSFTCLLNDRVSWNGRAGTYIVIWRRWHQGQVGEHIIYGIMKEEEVNDPVGQVWTALEKDLKRLHLQD
jgi:hypothetical protein